MSFLLKKFDNTGEELVGRDQLVWRALRQQVGRRTREARGIGLVVGMVREMQEEVLEQMDQMDLQQRQTLVRMLVTEVRVYSKDVVELFASGLGQS